MVDTLETCKPGRKRKAADMSDGCRPNDAAEMHQATAQMTQPCQGQTLASSSEEEPLSAGRCSAQHADSRQSQDVTAPNVDGRIVAGKSEQEDVEASRAEADSAGQQEPLHMACLQILASTVADGLNRPGGQEASMGEPALHVAINPVAHLYKYASFALHLQSCC